MRKLEQRHWALVAVVVLGIAARLWYRAHGVRFSAVPLDFYIQFLDPDLLRHDLLRSLFYLRDQPPLFNAFLGLVVKLFPVHYAQAFGAIYFTFGLMFGVVLYQLMVRLRVAPWWAALVTVLFVDSPITSLYENWLFYTFPLAVLVCACALFLHRYLESRRFADAVLFFALLATVVLTRNIFHPIWMLTVALALVLVERGRRKQVALAALGPTLVIVALLVKHAVVFHALFWGRPIQQINLAVMTSMKLPESLRNRLIREGKLSIISNISIVAGPRGYRLLVPPQPKTGIPALDMEYKPGSGYPNYNHTSYVPVGELYGRDAMYALRHYPRVYYDAVEENIARYYLPGDQVDPFNTRKYENRLALQPLLEKYNRWLAWQRPPENEPKLHEVGFPLLLVFALAVVAHALWRRQLLARPSPSPLRADALTVAFALYTTLWVSAVTILFSYGDHNRYRYKVSAFYCLFAALLGQYAWTSTVRVIRWARARLAKRSDS
jgi:hypothetical protein